MVHFKPKGRKRMRNIENKNYRFVSFLPDAQKKILKKFKKLKNTITDLFQAKISWRRMSKRKQKLQFRFVPIRRVTENSQKNSKKIQKIKKYHYCLI